MHFWQDFPHPSMRKVCFQRKTPDVASLPSPALFKTKLWNLHFLMHNLCLQETPTQLSNNTEYLASIPWIPGVLYYSPTLARIIIFSFICGQDALQLAEESLFASRLILFNFRFFNHLWLVGFGKAIVTEMLKQFQNVFRSLNKVILNSNQQCCKATSH